MFALIGGWTVLNFFRIFVNSLLSPYVVNNELQNEMTENRRQLSGCAQLLDFLIVSDDSREIIRDLIIVTSEANKTAIGDNDDDDLHEY